MSIDDFRELQQLNDYSLATFLGIYKEFGEKLSNSKYVEFHENVITIDYFTYKFISKHQMVFENGISYLRIKFETTTIDDRNYHFDIYLRRDGVIKTEYSNMLDGYRIDTIKQSTPEVIERQVANLMFQFFTQNEIIE
ncbi:hypothetical protein ACIMS2_003345 [Vibrio harveyi]